MAMLKALPVAFWAVLAGLAALLMAFIRVYSSGRAAGEAKADVTRARENADQVRQQAAAGDDAGVQKALADATEKAKKLTGLILVLLLAHASALAAERPDCGVRPGWCRQGFDCLPTECAAESAAQLGLLTTMLDNSRKAKPSRFHADLTCGPGLATALDRDFGMHLFPTPGACIIGLAIRIGK